MTPKHLKVEYSWSLESSMQMQPLPANMAQNPTGCTHQSDTHQVLTAQLTERSFLCEWVQLYSSASEYGVKASQCIVLYVGSSCRHQKSITKMIFSLCKVYKLTFNLILMTDCPQEPVAPHTLLGLLEGRAGGVLQCLEARSWVGGLAGLAGKLCRGGQSSLNGGVFLSGERTSCWGTPESPFSRVPSLLASEGFAGRKAGWGSFLPVTFPMAL